MELNFDVANDKYMQFIQDLRDTAKDPGEVSHGRPILPLEKDADGQHINVNIQVGGSGKGTLRIRRYDLRLMVYEQPHGTLVNITDFDVYDNLGSLDFGGVPFYVGPSTLVEAVEFLADPGKDITDLKEKNGVRSSLLALDVLLCEGAKLSALAMVFSNVFKTGLEMPLYSWMLKLISDWEYLSEELLGPDHDKKDPYCDYYSINPDDDYSHCNGRRAIGPTCQDMVRCLGILRGTVPTEYIQHLVDDRVEGGEYLVELYSVLVYIDGGKSGRIYGSIEVKENTTPCSYRIYHRDPTKCEYIESNGTLSLKGPAGVLDASDLFEMELDLKERDTDLSICKGKMYWKNDRNEYDPDMLICTRHSVIVKGENGYAIVFYTVFDKAVVATVEATLELKNGVRGSKNGNSSSDIFVSGSIVARTEGYNYSSEYEQKYYQSVLFRESCDQRGDKQGILVRLGVPMSLSRNVVAVVTHNYFTIVAKLQSSVGKTLVAGSMSMKPQDQGTIEGLIGQESDAYMLRLIVSWKKKNH